MHPIIHLGYAIEFSQPLLGAEALASTAAHEEWPGAIGFPAEKLARSRPRSPTTTLSSLIQRVRADPVISTAVRVEDAPNKILSGLVPRAGSQLAEILADFTVTPDELPRKTAEMINNAAYNMAVSQQPGKRIMMDFFLMHCVNTSLWFSVLLDTPWISDAAKCRLLEWKARLDVGMFAACRTPTPYPKRLWRYVPKRPSPAGEEGWEALYARAVAYKDDGHVTKLMRSLRNGQEVTRPYDREVGFDLPADAFLLVGHMVMDSVERMDDADYRLPDVLPYFKGLNEEILRITVRWVRWCGLKEAWNDVEPLPGTTASL